MFFYNLGQKYKDVVKDIIMWQKGCHNKWENLEKVEKWGKSLFCYVYIPHWDYTCQSVHHIIFCMGIPFLSSPKNALVSENFSSISYTGNDSTFLIEARYHNLLPEFDEKKANNFFQNAVESSVWVPEENLIFRIQNDDILIFEHSYFPNRKENQFSRVRF